MYVAGNFEPKKITADSMQGVQAQTLSREETTQLRRRLNALNREMASAAPIEPQLLDEQTRFSRELLAHHMAGAEDFEGLNPTLGLMSQEMWDKIEDRIKDIQSLLLSGLLSDPLCQKLEAEKTELEGLKLIA